MQDFTEAQIAAWNDIEKSALDLSALPEKYRSLNTSDRIRAMYRDGYSRGAIAKLLGKRYQHVRNVLVYESKKKQTA